jgi:hypothetical protein
MASSGASAPGSWSPSEEMREVASEVGTGGGGGALDVVVVEKDENLGRRPWRWRDLSPLEMPHRRAC